MPEALQVGAKVLLHFLYEDREHAHFANRESEGFGRLIKVPSERVY